MTNKTKYLIGGAIAVAAVYFLFFYEGKKVKLKYNFVANFNKNAQEPESGDVKMANFRIPRWANKDYEVTADNISSLLKGRTVVVKNAEGKKAGTAKVRRVFNYSGQYAGSDQGDIIVQLDMKYDDVMPKAKIHDQGPNQGLGTLVTA